MSYATKTDIAGVGEEFTIPTGYSDSDINSLITDAESLIDKLTNDHFESHSKTIYISGNGATTIFLSNYTLEDYLEDDSMVITEREYFGDQWLSANQLSSKSFMAYKSRVVITNQYVSNVRVTEYPGVWTVGDQNYRIVANFGHTSVPSGIKLATAYIVREWIQPGWSRSLDIQEEWWDDYRYRIAKNPPSMESTTGIVYVDRLLKPHIKNKLTFGCA